MRSPDDELEQLEREGLRRHLHEFEARWGTELEDADRERLINFSSNDYLGLAQEPALAEAIARGAREHGAGAAASRLVCGTLPVHESAEAHLAAFKGTQLALLFSSGYAASLGAVSALAGAEDFILLDRLAHASLIDGTKLSGAPYRPFRHNDLDHLNAQMAKARARLAPQARILVLAESVYSMDGDCAPVAGLHELCLHHDALLVLDEAHALGVLGPQGRGLAAEAGISNSERLIQLGTLSKAAGLQGGFLAGRANWMELIVNRARSFIYTTGVLPALANAVPTALTLVEGLDDQGSDRRERLWAHLRRVTDALNLPPAASAILPLHIGDEGEAMDRSRALRERGLLVPAIRFPTVARGGARLRLTLSCAHTDEQVGQLIAALAPI